MNERNDTFEVVGGGDTPLTAEQKACLLRAARTELRKLQAELYRLKSINTRYAGGPIAATEAEIECLSAAVSWLWNHKGGGP
jgi:hypothetical protein